MLDLGLKGCMFEARLFLLRFVLVQPRKTGNGPDMTGKLLTET